jgi:hypothetical protein
LPFSLLYEAISYESLRLESEDGLYDFISKGNETNREMFCLLEFVRLGYCSMDLMNDFLGLLSEYSYEINASMWASIRARLVLPNGIGKQFPPSVKKGKVLNPWDKGINIDVPDGMIAHLTRECGGNVHDCKVVDVTSGSFEKEIYGAYNNEPMLAAKNAADLETDSCFMSAYRDNKEDIPHTRNNWICYDFKKRRIVPTHYTIRMYGPSNYHLKSWFIETSVDGENWREVTREEDNKQLNDSRFIGTFPVAGAGERRFIRLVNIGRNHYGNDCLLISAWEIFGSLIE